MPDVVELYKPRVRRKKAPRTRVKVKLNKSLVARADKHFADQIKTRDGECQFPGCQITDPAKLTCSHYHSRAKWGTRYEPKNCIALCRNHHYWDKQLGWEFQKQQKGIHGWDGQYTIFMKNWLGEDEFRFLGENAAKTGQRKIVLAAYQKLLCELQSAKA